ncbi:response regulator transcription factor [Deinococcus sp. 14RED07]|uniref:response regulator n=1 Tax=Deinococcus sp. 14RED07 TaxID=2745874 RepID=UPI001E52E1E0|nr:response regulator transcription factor [Deinococcus sp. 14RED07]MCD0174671.1 response regulator transcription factor [Deinococcus sp. 14RED07]
MIRVALCDDQALVRQGLGRLLELASDISVVTQASSAESSCAALLATPVDVVLLDVRFRDGTGMDVLERLTRCPAPPAALMLTTFPDDDAMLRCLQLGARGFLLKDIEFEALLHAIRFVHAGGRLVLPTPATSHASSAPRPSRTDDFELTGREAETLRLMGSGLNNRELATLLGVTEGTVKNRVSNILLKLGVRDRTRAVLKGIEAGLI